MTWVWLTLLNVVANGTVVALFKRETKLTQKPSTGILATAFIVAAISFLPVSFYFGLVTDLRSMSINSYGWYLLGLVVASLAAFLYIRAIKMAELSVIGPVETLRPFFVILLSFLILRQLPTGVQLAGILLIITGALVLNMKDKLGKTLIREKGVQLLLISTAVFALSGIVDKIALGQIPATTYAQIIMIGLAIIYGLGYFRDPGHQPVLKVMSPTIIVCGLLYTVGFASIMAALKLSDPNLVIPLQMTRSLYIAILGVWWFREKDYGRKLVAGVLMLLGVGLMLQ